MTLAGRIVIMNKGIVQQVGSPIEVYRKPANLFVAGFIGSPTMNFMHGTLKLEGEALTEMAPLYTVPVVLVGFVPFVV